LEDLSPRWPKVLYGSLFVAVLPALLLVWAYATRNAVTIATPQSALWGTVLAVTGMVTMLLGMLSLWKYGGGLPMNAFPPPRFVRGGIYALIPHPIYGGFVLICGGLAIFSGSSSGLLLVTPSVAMASAALVLGHELPDLRRRFGAQASFPCQPTEPSASPSILYRLRISIAVLLPWLAGYGLIWALGRPPGAIATYMPFEQHLPISVWTEGLYASTYVIAILTPFLVRTNESLHRFAVRGLTAMALIFSLYLLLPFFVPPRPFQPSSAIGELLLLERTSYSGVGAFPSFHVVWALIAASVLGQGSLWRRAFWWTWAALVSISCVTTGMHSVLDVLAGIAAFVLVMNAGRIWTVILRSTEGVANSWQELHFGNVRIINHGGYAAVASFVGIVVIGALLPARCELIPVSIFLCSIAGAALWAQWVEGSPALLRPLGFYGGMLGAIVGAIPVLLLGVNLWVALAAICVAAPWIQALGRLRCLVQGCCHGRATESVAGIVYSHPRSRVCRLAHLKGIPIHATPVYSILWNLLTGLFLLRMATLQCSSTMIGGIYLLLSGFGRFVEEAYRGEPQTRIVFGLRFYQWIAIIAVLSGAAVTTVHGPSMAQGFQFRVSTLLLATGCGVAAWFVTGVDFPLSSRRFARLT
jgi:membrane-associated phospholipid phosphatase/protein-S-isoprenylcysteine O-methyltransferase Ste14